MPIGKIILFIMRSQTSSRSDDVSQLSNVRPCSGACEKIRELLPTAWSYLQNYSYFSCVCAVAFVPRTPPKRHRFRPRCRLWRPNICTFIHLCSRPKPFELVELGRVMCSNYHRRHWDYKLILGCYHLVPRTIYENTVYLSLIHI